MCGSCICFVVFLFYGYGDHRDLHVLTHAFPTRRSSDLLRGDVSRKMIQSGAMGLIYAHLFSLSLIRDLFTRQMAEGNLPPSTPAGDAPASVEGADQGVAND